MSRFVSEDEVQELESLKRDLTGPVKSFWAEVREDTVGDAGRFYASKARKARQSAQLAQEKAQARLDALRREQARLQMRRRAMMKRAALILALLALFSAAVLFAALPARAEEPDGFRHGEACLTESTADYGEGGCEQRLSYPLP